MTPEQLAEIKARAEFAVPFTKKGTGSRGLAERDVPELLAEIERLREKLTAPCGSCHPCTNYRDETWRAADRKPPHVHEWDELRAEVERLRAELAETQQRAASNEWTAFRLASWNATAKKTAREMGPMIGGDPARHYSRRLIAELSGEAAE